jgi:hypothetical protein
MMHWTNGPLFCTLDVGGLLLAQCAKQNDGSWAGFDLSGQKGVDRIGSYSTIEEARPAVEKYMEAKI